MSTIIVGVIIFGIIGFSGYRTYKSHKNGGGCSCGCSSCGKSDSYCKH
ncbi:MAG: FeoB-associated Cys-rich membrane protein [Clostridium sp.]|nr:FeoB-associated Cys-rich membrane protein [Clostridium sp.]MCH3963816.1 FeoB-associated Cys-rich membrane protein [Clostridium sp.]MCI1716935.1 FeoB-associated Cys-rich membrane protein [Clostridium sp.]MCI1801346.1 FeoB-associated Cys-rich membrane protein [Clostridium sp.]MCI1815192.1 FeoB-associated Cys-rich membrane protein [Clostridium sp.]MCI1872024.1 FeoB-associated Cys-rich membrane protein [Clostridium sp.]